jgi:hypothetical protein
MKVTIVQRNTLTFPAEAASLAWLEPRSDIRRSGYVRALAGRFAS